MAVIVHHAGHGEGKSAALIERALYPDLAIVKLDQGAGDDKPKPETVVISRQRIVGLVKEVKDAGQFFRRDANSMVANTRDAACAVRARADPEGFAAR